jgi:iron complex transport system substrate-binding protein
LCPALIFCLLFANQGLGLAATVAATDVDMPVADDTGHVLHLAKPARRIISLAPHATELLYAAGAGARLVGVSAYSDYPPEAGKLPQVGDVHGLDLERIIALKPDLLVVWDSGTPARQMAQLQKLGIPIFRSEPRRLDDIASNMVRLGQLMGSSGQAGAAAATWRERMARLRTEYAGRKRLAVFYQVWHKPLYTLNGQHIVNDALQLCGATNVFAQLPVLAPEVSIEAVIQQNPEVIVAGAAGLAMWRQYPLLRAVAQGRLLALPNDNLSRPGPRMLDAVEHLCQSLDKLR